MDPPGHTVFLYLQELNRAELQQQAKHYGIKANQKSEILRQELQRVLAEKDNVKSPNHSVVVVDNEEETRDDAVVVLDVKEETIVDVDDESIVDDTQEEEEEAEVEVEETGIVSEEEERDVVAPVAEEDERLMEQPITSNFPEEHEEVKKEEPNVEAQSSQQQQEIPVAKQEESTTPIEMDSVNEEEEADGAAEGENQVEEQPVNDTPDEIENEESTAVPPQVVIVDIDSKEMADLADESIVSPCAAAKETFRSKIPSGPLSRGSRPVLGERSMNAKSTVYTSKLGKPQRYSHQSNISRIIRSKNSPTRPAPVKETTQNPVLATQTKPKPKQMALSRRNEMQLQKFVERQNRGRKNRETHLKRTEYANLVRSPGQAA